MSEPLNREILEQAGAWFIEFRSGQPGKGARDEFMQWLRRSPDHIRAYMEVSRTYVELPPAGVVPPTEYERLLEKARHRLQGDVIALGDQAFRRSPARAATPRLRARTLAVGAAALLLLMLGGGLWWELQWRGLYTTGPGEERTVTLADASRIELNGRTRLRVRYTKGTRGVTLLEGQALFQVAKDKQRPFIVDSGDARIRAVGTEFDVYRQGAQTTVTVLEGTVAVLPASAAAAPSVPATTGLLVSSGEQAVVTPDGSRRKARDPQVSAATAWTRGQLEFDETPLTQVAEEFNRSSPRALVLASPGLASVRISGIYSATDPTSLILFLRSQPDLEITESADQIQVRAKTP